MSAEWERESRLSDNFSKVPHGLWTCDLSHGAKCLLGWLHSHTSTYLATLTNGRIRAEYGSGGSVNRWIEELEQAGFVQVIVEKNRKRFRLMAAPWDALALRPRREKASDETVRNGPVHNGTVRNGPANGPKWTDNPSEMDPIEDHVEDQGEDQHLFPDATHQEPPPVTARDITGHYHDTFRQTHGSAPPQTSVKRIAQAAKHLLVEGYDPDAIIDATRRTAKAGHANLAATMTSLLAERSRVSEPKSYSGIREFVGRGQ
jgi:hypothetical protein